MSSRRDTTRLRLCGAHANQQKEKPTRGRLLLAA